MVILPELIIEKIKKNIRPQWKTCFIASIILGLIAHMYKITNWLPNWDSMVFRYNPQNMLSLGRWFLSVVCAPGSFYDLPWFAGLFAIIIHGLGAVCICKMFDVKKHITAFLIGGLIVTFPTVTSVLMYNYVADGYSTAFLLSTIAAVVLAKEKPNYGLSIVMIALSAGIYQAYITVTVMLLLCSLIMDIMYKGIKLRDTAVRCGKYLLTGLAGIILYYLILTLLLKLTGTELLDYQGVSSSFALSKLNLFGALNTTVCSFVNYFFGFPHEITVFNIINIAITIFTIAVATISTVKNKVRPSEFVLLAVLTMLMPAGANILAFINHHIDYHNLMKMGFAMFYIIFLLIYDKEETKDLKPPYIKSWITLGLASALIFNQVVIANVCYHKQQLSYEKSYGTLIRIADRIEQTEGSESCNRILVMGSLPGSEKYDLNLPPLMTGITDGYILRADDEVVNQSVLCSALNDYCGKDYEFMSGKEKSDFIKKNSLNKTDCWPHEGSVSVIENTIVIKLGTECE